MVTEIIKISKDDQEVFLFLNDLRNDGITNMFGAGVYIEREFGISKKAASQLLTTWMKIFNEEGVYETMEVTK